MVRSALVVLSLFALVAVGCAPHLGDRYTVDLDPVFSPEQQADVLAALDDWRAHVPVHLSPVVTACGGSHDHEICIHSSTRDAIVHEHGAGPYAYGITFGSSSGEDVDGAEMWIATDAIPDGDFQGVIAHELGHGMALEHETAPTRCLMAPSEVGWSRLVTPADAAQWLRLRGRS